MPYHLYQHWDDKLELKNVLSVDPLEMLLLILFQLNMNVLDIFLTSEIFTQ